MMRALMMSAVWLLATAAQADTPAENFTLKVTDGDAKVGEAATVSVVITGTNGFKANTEYPNKISELTGEGVKLAATAVDGAVKDGQLSYAVVATPTAAGKHAVSGKIRFSICDDSVCKLKTATLAGHVVGR